MREQLERKITEISEKDSFQDRYLQAQEELLAAKNQSISERNRAKKLARKLEDLKTRIIELKEDKNRLEEYVQNDRDLYSDLQDCLDQYRHLKSVFDGLIVFVKTALEKTTGEVDIEEIDPNTNELRLDFNR